MKIIAIAAVTAGGKTTVVNELKSRLPGARSLHFDDYAFEGEVEDFGQWVTDGADYQVWNLQPLQEDIEAIRAQGQCECLLLDYPFAYCHHALRECIDCAIFIDTPLDMALARRVLRDQQAASGEEIRQGLMEYLQYARPAYLQMLKDILPSSDHVIDGAQPLSAQADEIMDLIAACKAR